MFCARYRLMISHTMSWHMPIHYSARAIRKNLSLTHHTRQSIKIYCVSIKATRISVLFSKLGSFAASVELRRCGFAIYFNERLVLLPITRNFRHFIKVLNGNGRLYSACAAGSMSSAKIARREIKLCYGLNYSSR